MNPQNLLEQFLGPDVARSAGGAVQRAKGGLADSGMGGIAGGVAAGGLLGLLLGNKKARKKVGNRDLGLAQDRGPQRKTSGMIHDPGARIRSFEIAAEILQDMMV